MKLRALRPFLLSATILSVLAASASAANVTALSLTSQRGDQLGRGANYHYTSADGTFSTSGSSQTSVHISFSSSGNESWSMRFTAPTGSNLVAGTYENVTASATATNAALSVGGLGSGSNLAAGRFVIKEISFGPGETLTALHAVFEFHPDRKSPALFGEVWFNVNVPTILPARSGIVAPTATSVNLTVEAGEGASGFVAAGLPPGLSLDATTGVISGQTAEFGNYLVDLSATRAGEPVAGLYALVLLPPINATSLSLVGDPGEFVGNGQTYLYTTVDTNIYIGPNVPNTNSRDRVRFLVEQFSFGGSDSWFFEVADLTGAPLTARDYGTASASPVGSGPYLSVGGNGRGGGTTGRFRIHEIAYLPNGVLGSFTATFEQSSGNPNVALRGTMRYNAHARVTGPNRVNGTRGSAFSHQVVANNLPSFFSAQGLPAGLTIHPQTGLISGTPTVSGFFQVEITAAGVTTAVSVLILAITPLPPVISGALTAVGNASQPFDLQLVIENDPLVIETQQLPPGLSVDLTGRITGFPRQSASFTSTITAANQTGSDSHVVRITINPQNRILTNVSTRLKVQTGDNLLIGGFVIDGPVSKKVLIRGVGPSLQPFLTGFLADPTLELRDANGTLLASNDDWENQPGADAAQIASNQFRPQNAVEPALIRTLNPGAYTVLLRGKGEATGVALVEVYDQEQDAGKLANISTRGRVETADNVMIGGFVVAGTSPVQMLVRAIGPSLSAAGLPASAVLQDPMLEVRSAGGTLVASSDDWREGNVAAITASGFPPTDDRESAIVLTLTPGSYTAIVRGKNGGTGIALVEAYRLSP